MKTSDLLAVLILAIVTPLALAAIGLASTTPLAPGAVKVDASVSSNDATNLTLGVVQQFDDKQGRITIKHEALENIGMPPMTMVFNLGNVPFGDKVKAGDPILFRAERINNAFVVTRLNKLILA